MLSSLLKNNQMYSICAYFSTKNQSGEADSEIPSVKNQKHSVLMSSK